MDLGRAKSEEIGRLLDRAGITWSYDDDGDVRVRFRPDHKQWIDAVFYEMTADWSMRCQFLNGRAVPVGGGVTQWEVPTHAGLTPTAIAQKVVTVYLMPGSGGLDLQIHAAFVPLNQAAPMHIRSIPGRQQISLIERDYPGFVGVESDTQFWMMAGVTGAQVDEESFVDLLRTTSQIGLQMMEGPFTGWLYSTEV